MHEAMPTVHYAKRKFLNKNDLVIPWTIGVEPNNRQADPTQITGRKCSSCASDLEQASGDGAVEGFRGGGIGHAGDDDGGHQAMLEIGRASCRERVYVLV